MTGSFRSYGKINPNEQNLLQSKRKARRRCLVIVLSSVILVAAIVGLVVGVVIRARSKHSENSATTDDGFSQGSKAIQAACNTTLYPEVCTQELTSYPGSISANPRELVSIAFKIALEHVREAYSFAQSVAGLINLDVYEKAAAQDCVELMDDAMDQLNASIAGISDMNLLDLKSFNQTIMELKVLLSTSLSYQTVCAEGFVNLTGNVPDGMVNRQEDVSQVLIISLCLLDTFSKLGRSLSSWLDAFPALPNVHLRRLLSEGSSSQDNYADSNTHSFSSHSPPDEFPEWLPAGDRKLLRAPTSSVTPNITVAQDGTGQYRTILEALKHVPETNSRFVIYIKRGIYKEFLTISKKLINLTLLGDGINSTIITGNRSVAIQKYTTFQSATVGISAKGFLARGITFRNTAGPQGHQAVAVRAGADFIVFDKCSFEGYQDTLYALSSRQFYRSCTIYGTVDYIFGNAIAVFQNCKLLARLPIQGQQNTYTAQGRKVSVDVSGFSFQNCTLTTTPELNNSSYVVWTYLGRPWKAYSRTVFMQSYMDALVRPAGWLAWNASNPFINTVYYGEYENRGPGSNTDSRVKWKGVHPVMRVAEAIQFTVYRFIAGVDWLPQTEVQFDQSLSS